LIRNGVERSDGEERGEEEERRLKKSVPTNFKNSKIPTEANKVLRKQCLLCDPMHPETLCALNSPTKP